MANLGVRKLVLHKETIEREGGGTSPDGPVTRVAGIAVVANPHAGGFVEDLSDLFALGAALGERLMAEMTPLLPGPAVSYGKAAIVGDVGQSGARPCDAAPDAREGNARADRRRQGVDTLGSQGRCCRRNNRHSTRSQGRCLVLRSFRCDERCRKRRTAAR